MHHACLLIKYVFQRYGLLQDWKLHCGPSCCEEGEDEQKENPVTESAEGQGDQRICDEAWVESTQRVHPSVTHGF